MMDTHIAPTVQASSLSALDGGATSAASSVAFSGEEIRTATALLDEHGVCIARVQRKLKIGWNRAADLVEHIKGREVLPAVALRRAK